MGRSGVKCDLTGQRFGRLTVDEYIETANRISWWKCRCDCGNVTKATTNSLKSGHKRSCGCLATEYRKNKTEAVVKARIANTTHGETNTKLFRTWTAMRNRCSNPRNPAYKWYGAKGIKVCNEWADYENFRKWSFENGYDELVKGHALSIDRIDPNGDYCPGNCRWTNVKTQNENKSIVKVFEYKGETGTLGYFARKYGFKECTLRWRTNKLHWSIEKALTTQPWQG